MTTNFNNFRQIFTKTVLYKNSVKLTTDRFPKLKRGPYATVDPTDVDYFIKLLGVNNFVTGEEVKSYNEDWLKSVSGK